MGHFTPVKNPHTCIYVDFLQTLLRDCTKVCSLGLAHTFTIRSLSRLTKQITYYYYCYCTRIGYVLMEYDINEMPRKGPSTTILTNLSLSWISL